MNRYNFENNNLQSIKDNIEALKFVSLKRFSIYFIIFWFLIFYRLKRENFCTAITSKIVTSGQRIEDHWKRDSFLFKTLFDLSSYDFRFRRYPRVKERVIFNRLLSPFFSFLLGSLALADLYQVPDKWQTRFPERHDSWKDVVHISRKKCRSLVGGSIHNFCTHNSRSGNFESSYLGNRSRYRDESKSGFIWYGFPYALSGFWWEKFSFFLFWQFYNNTKSRTLSFDDFT